MNNPTQEQMEAAAVREIYPAAFRSAKGTVWSERGMTKIRLGKDWHDAYSRLPKPPQAPLDTKEETEASFKKLTGRSIDAAIAQSDRMEANHNKPLQTAAPEGVQEMPQEFIELAKIFWRAAGMREGCEVIMQHEAEWLIAQWLKKSKLSALPVAEPKWIDVKQELPKIKEQKFWRFGSNLFSEVVLVTHDDDDDLNTAFIWEDHTWRSTSKVGERLKVLKWQRVAPPTERSSTP